MGSGFCVSSCYFREKNEREIKGLGLREEWGVGAQSKRGSKVEGGRCQKRLVKPSSRFEAQVQVPTSKSMHVLQLLQVSE